LYQKELQLNRSAINKYEYAYLKDTIDAVLEISDEKFSYGVSQDPALAIVSLLDTHEKIAVLLPDNRLFPLKSYVKLIPIDISTFSYLKYKKFPIMVYHNKKLNKLIQEVSKVYYADMVMSTVPAK
jgi:hypothetical protein